MLFTTNANYPPSLSFLHSKPKSNLIVGQQFLTVLIRFLHILHIVTPANYPATTSSSAFIPPPQANLIFAATY